MASRLLHKRGLKADLSTLADGQFGLATDTKELFIGNSGNAKVANLDQKFYGAAIGGGGGISSQTGSWLTFNGGASTTGKYVYDVSEGAFVSTIYATATAFDNGSTNAVAYFESVTTSQIIVHTLFNGVATNLPLMLIAIGF